MFAKLIEAFKWREVLAALVAGTGIAILQWEPGMPSRDVAAIILTTIGSAAYTGVVTRKIATGIANAGLAALAGKGK